MAHSPTAELLSTLRHDLKTPLNQIIGYGEMLLEDADAASAEASGAALRSLLESAHACLEVQTRALTRPVSEVTTGTWEDLRTDQVARAAHMQELLGRLRDCPGAEECASDLDRLTQAVGNLDTLATEAPGRWTGGALEKQEEEKQEEETEEAPAVLVFLGTQREHAEREEAATLHATAPEKILGRLLVVDDNAVNRDMLSRRLTREGYSVTLAVHGRDALDKLEREDFDLVLLDIMMPELDGFAVLQRIRSNPRWKEMAVIMISALDEISSVVRCIEMGAEDYLPKPFDPVLLRARIGAILERKRLRDEERKRAAEMESALREVERQKKVAEDMLLNILPARVASELQNNGTVEPMYFEDVTIGFTDFVGFTVSTERLAAEELVGLLHEYFTAFDGIIARYGLEKLKTIGDSYMFVSGMPDRQPAHPVDAVLAALEMVETVKNMARPESLVGWQVRIGLHTGPVIAGVVGVRKFAFDIWGDSVNFASRMESSSEPNRVNLSERTYSRVKDFIHCTPRGHIRTKDGREVDMFFAEGAHEKLMGDRGQSPPAAFARRYRIYFQQDVKAFPEFLLQPGKGDPPPRS